MRAKGKYTKYIFFDSKEVAERFINLYGGFIFNDVECSDAWLMKYFGHKVRGKICVDFRTETERFNDIKKSISLKEKKSNGRKYYVMA